MRKLILTLTILLFTMKLFSEDNNVINQRSKESDPEYHKQRKEWLESMHRTEQGVNYKVLISEFKKDRMIKKNENRKKIEVNSPKLQKFVADNGKIIGNWVERGSNNQSGRIHTADVDLSSNLVYAASAGGNVWRGDLEGKNWICLNNSTQFDIRNIKVEKINNNRRIFVFSADNLYFSDNEGFSWESSAGLDNMQNWGWINRGIIINDNDNLKIYILVDEWNYTTWKQIKSVYFSDDNGVSFKFQFSVPVTENIDIWGVEKSIGEYIDNEINEKFRKLIYVHQDSIFSLNGTEKELLSTPSDISLLKPNRIRINGIENSDGVVLYLNMSEQNNNNLNVFTTNDFGFNLHYKGLTPTNYFMNNSFGISKLNSDIAFIGGVECHKTTNAGVNWSMINSWPEYYADPLNKLHADIPSVKSFRINENEDFFLIATDGGLYKTNSQYKIENISLNGLNVSQYYSIFTHYNNVDEYIYAGSQDQGYQRSEAFKNKILDFEQTISGDYGSLTSGDGGNSIWTVYPGFAMYYPDAVKSTKNYSWTFTGQYNDRVWMPPIVAVPGEPNIAYIASGGTKSGTSKINILTYDWMSNRISNYEMPYQFDSQESDNDVSALEISKLDKNYIYAATKNGKFYSSTDAGLSWTESQDFIAPDYNYLHGSCIWASEINLGRVYVTGSGYSNPGVFVSEDNGKTFVALEGLPPCYVYQIDLNETEDVIFAATSVGPFVYINNHKRWYDISGIDAPDQTYWTVNYLPWKKTARFGTYGRGIWDFEIETLITSIANEVVESNLDIKCYPNPSNGIFNINFKAEPGKFAEIKILDLEGKLIDKCFSGLVMNVENNLSINLNKNKLLPNGFYTIILKQNGLLKYFKLNIQR